MNDKLKFIGGIPLYGALLFNDFSGFEYLKAPILIILGILLGYRFKRVFGRKNKSE